LIQLVENGMPLPHEKGGKKETSSAIVCLLLVRVEGAEKITGKSMYFARKETCGNKNSELLYIQ